MYMVEARAPKKWIGAESRRKINWVMDFVKVMSTMGQEAEVLTTWVGPSCRVAFIVFSAGKAVPIEIFFCWFKKSHCNDDWRNSGKWVLATRHGGIQILAPSPRRLSFPLCGYWGEWGLHQGESTRDKSLMGNELIIESKIHPMIWRYHLILVA